MQPVKNILVLTYWSYADALIQAYTLPYLKILASQLPQDCKIYLLTLERPGNKVESKDPRIELIQMTYAPFGIRGAWMWLKLLIRLERLIRSKKVDAIHAWCTPPGMMGYLLSRTTGKPLILDSFEPHAEAMVENGQWTKSSAAFRLLFRFERLQAKHAVAQICASSGMIDYSRQKYDVQLSNPFVKPACVDLNIFSPSLTDRTSLRSDLGLDDKVVAVYAGKFGGIYLDTEIFEFARTCRDHWGEKFHLLLLTSSLEQQIEQYAAVAGLHASAYSVRFVPFSEVPKYLNSADFGLTPVKPVPTKRYCTPIKDGEYWGVGLPVVITRDISDDSDIIDSNRAGYVLQELNKDEYLRAVIRIDELLKGDRDELRARIRGLAEKYRNFEMVPGIYSTIYGPSSSLSKRKN